MKASSLEHRMAELEQEVARLKRRVNKNGNGGWVEKILGSMANKPAFDDAMKLAAEIRRKDQSR